MTVIWASNGGLSHQISLTSNAELRTMGATECLDVFENGTAPGAKVS
jgi:hypothetical protein